MPPVFERKPITKRINKAFGDSVYNQAELARKIGVSAATVSRWLSGETVNIDQDTRNKIANILHINLNWLETGEGPMTPTRTGEPSVAYLDQIDPSAIDEISLDEMMKFLEHIELLARSVRGRLIHLKNDKSDD